MRITEDAKEWRESPFRIPVIEAMDVRRNLCQQTEDYFFNSFSMQQNNAGVNDRPYWMECKDESVCIVNCETGFCTGLEEKLLPDDRFICVNGAELKGMYVGHSAPKTKVLFEKTAQRINRKPKNCSAFCQ